MTNYRPWKIVHLRLEEALPALDRDPEIGGLYLVFWFQQIVLGHAKVQADRLPMSALNSEVLALETIEPTVAAFLNAAKGSGTATKDLGETPARDTRASPNLTSLLNRLNSAHVGWDMQQDGAVGRLTVSIAVCTRERPDALELCLASLKRLEPQPMEIIVVDNAPVTRGTRDVVAGFDGIRYVVEPKAGLSHARNTAMSHCSGEIIAFTDDDVTVEPHWLEGLLRGFAEPKVMALTGLILPAELKTEAQMIFESCWSFNRGYQPRTYCDGFMSSTRHGGAPVSDIGAGANMAFRREVLNLGLFDVGLGAGAAGCSEDSEYWYRILHAGWHCRYEPTAIVHHYHRGDMEGLKGQIRSYMRGHIAALLVQWRRYGDVGNLRRVGAIFLKFPRRVFLGLKGRTSMRHRTLWPELFGCLSGVTYFMVHLRRPSRKLP